MNPNIIGPFEYVTILISIILGLGITQVLSSMAEAFYHDAKVRFYLPHSIWVIIVLFLHIQDWFILYEMRTYPVWKLPAFLFICLYPITLFTITRLLFPPIAEKNGADLKTFFLSKFPKIFYLFAVCIGLSILYNIIFLNAPWQQQLFLLVPLVIFVVMAFLRIQNEKLHGAVAIIVALAIIITTLVESDMWYVK